ncbi:ABC transporter ATP-binding protein [Paraburkholderia silvatlantica]|uniref:Sulfonate transport system ATP-binding protein n=1 Tax=Paraburkholderia silvatlantica TaxID=321895 RepID=A0ABR6FH72_9BURK|nr:ABC transporter ATP-binding protein [Paraburkholderia silvatlantica]MBB2926753.1 sulfonate transport system ATP-binding protein [Paraburkholderia silvatlantica]PVY37619.1 sulfonate transport system ATP-binding protein [Paraburkholderia silvatlantica]PXW42581.1 sulfonate transport system ATP-binding protein [Paraburkholderia silvatlantica]TDR05009.1 sulfonate transport system ATP-binding protein [Paraburkholderia silvatlantica]
MSVTATLSGHANAIDVIEGATRRETETAASPLAVSVRGLQRRYGARVVIDALDLDIRKGEFVALLGESGCGKTTLLRALAGLDTPDAGQIRAPERPSVVFQEHRLLPWANLWENVALGHESSIGRAGASRALAEVGLAGRERDWPRNLSGGQAQRVALARALVREPALLLLDEPFAALDALTRIKMHGLVKELVARHAPGVLIVTHDVDEALALADRILVMRAGRIAASFHPKDHTPQDLRLTLLEELGVQSH